MKIMEKKVGPPKEEVEYSKEKKVLKGDDQLRKKIVNFFFSQTFATPVLAKKIM